MRFRCGVALKRFIRYQLRFNGQFLAQVFGLFVLNLGLLLCDRLWSNMRQNCMLFVYPRTGQNQVRHLSLLPPLGFFKFYTSQAHVALAVQELLIGLL